MRKPSLRWYVRIHGTEEYARVSKTIVRQLEIAGYVVVLDTRIEGCVFVELAA